jgi:hypothetical protein
MGLAPRAALIAVQALLRCLFKNNVPFLSASAPGYNDFKERKKERLFSQRSIYMTSFIIGLAILWC